MRRLPYALVAVLFTVLVVWQIAKGRTLSRSAHLRYERATKPFEFWTALMVELGVALFCWFLCVMG